MERLSSKCWSDLKGEDCTDVYPAHLTPSVIQAGLKAGNLVQGSFFASRDNCLEASVVTDQHTVRIFLLFMFKRFLQKFIYSYLQIFIQGRASLNRAIDGDTVAIEILPKNEWKAPSNLVIQTGILTCFAVFYCFLSVILKVKVYNAKNKIT